MNPSGAMIAAVADVRTHLCHHSQARPWDAPGIRAALTSTRGAVADVLAAAILTAGDPAWDAPSERAFRAHWPANGGEKPAPRWTPCGEHPDQDAANCPLHGGDMSADEIAAAARRVRDELAAARAAHVPPAVARAKALENQEGKP